MSHKYRLSPITSPCKLHVNQSRVLANDVNSTQTSTAVSYIPTTVVSATTVYVFFSRSSDKVAFADSPSAPKHLLILSPQLLSLPTLCKNAISTTQLYC